MMWQYIYYGTCNEKKHLIYPNIISQTKMLINFFKGNEKS